MQTDPEKMNSEPIEQLKAVAQLDSGTYDESNYIPTPHYPRLLEKDLPPDTNVHSPPKRRKLDDKDIELEPTEDFINKSGGVVATTTSLNNVIALPQVHSDDNARYVDITQYLNMPQAQAAEKLGIPTSTLSKRWKEVVRNRKWPYRTISKLDKEIMALLHNIPQGPDKLSPEIESALGNLLRRRQEELKPVKIRI